MAPTTIKQYSTMSLFMDQNKEENPGIRTALVNQWLFLLLLKPTIERALSYITVRRAFQAAG